jgi:hypothetical protein
MKTAKNDSAVPKVIGGIGEKNSNSNTQWRQQDRIYDSEHIATALAANLPGGGQLYVIYLNIKGDKDD